MEGALCYPYLYPFIVYTASTTTVHVRVRPMRPYLPSSATLAHFYNIHSRPHTRPHASSATPNAFLPLPSHFASFLLIACTHHHDLEDPDTLDLAARMQLSSQSLPLPSLFPSPQSSPHNRFPSPHSSSPLTPLLTVHPSPAHTHRTETSN
eukprot:245043-Chlamydomonas_euryale.AAC.1